MDLSLRLVTLLFFLHGVLGRTFTVKNNCPYTVWPAVFTDLNVKQSVPDTKTGWEAPAGSSTSFNVPDDWTAGRIWARRDCDFSTGKTDPTACASGGCNGGIECDPHTGTGVPPVTLAEWTLGTNGAPDNYDVSLVDGFNIPISVTTSVDCPAPDCKADLNANCPQPLVLEGPDHSVFGCMTACFANLDKNPGDSANCCTGSHNIPATCPPSGVQFYSYFKGACPNAYAYAYDEGSGTALWTCPSEKKADYVVTFCP